MSKRNLLIGASSPIAYSYVTENMLGRPAPILETPVAYCLLYDDIWFLSRTLCPPELENLDFVHFVNEEHAIDLPFDKIPDEENRRFDDWNWDLWQHTVDTVTGDGRKYRCDNHARETKIFGIPILPTPGSRANLFFDRFIATELGFELAENSPNAKASELIETAMLHTEVAERLIGPRFSSLQKPFGFWHPVLQDLRSDSSLKAFRKKLASMDIENFEEITKHVETLDLEYRRLMREALKDRLAPKGFIKSTAVFIIGYIPIIGKIVGPVDYVTSIISKIRDRNRNNWTRFLCSVEERTEQGTTTDAD